MAEQWSEVLAIREQGVDASLEDIQFSQHQIISGLVDSMAPLIVAFGEKNNVDIPLEFAAILCWGGLTDTVAWTVLPFVDQLLYNEVINTERHATEGAFGNKCSD